MLTDENALAKKSVQTSKSTSLTSLSRPLLDSILAYLDHESLRQLRLICIYLRNVVDLRLLSVTFGTAEHVCGPLALVANWQRWPNIQEIKLSIPGSSNPYPEEPVTNKRSSGDMGVESLACAGWTRIEVLDLSRGELGYHSGAALAFCSHRWPKLRVLNLSENALRDSGFIKLSLGSFPSLEYLDLSYNRIGLDSRSTCPILPAAMARLLSRCPKLKELNLRRNELTDVALKSIVAAEMPCLECLNLSGNLFRDFKGSILAAANWPSIRKIYFELHNALSEAAVQSIFRKEWPLLEEINFSLDLSLEDARGLRKAAERWPALRRLGLANMDLSAADLELILGVKWESLQHLDLSGNLSVEVCRVVAAKVNGPSGARNFPKLISLNLEDYQMNAEALDCLFVHPWPQLQELSLGHDYMRVEAAAALAKAVECNKLPALKSFIYSRGRPSLLKALLETPWHGLTYLSLLFCKIGIREARCFDLIAERLPALRSLRVRDDPEYIGGNQILDLILQNTWGNLEEIEYSFFTALPVGQERNWRVAGTILFESEEYEKGIGTILQRIK